MRQSDPDWLNFVNTTFNVNMFGHISEAYDKAMQEFFGIQPRPRTPGFPPI
jgi:polar amino acid transport system substrate-binding protein